MLTGTGTYAGNVAVSGGTFTPGTSTTVGTIASIGGNLSVTSGTFRIKVSGASADQVTSITGSVSFASNSFLSVSQLAAPANSSYTILTANSGLSGLTAGTLVSIGRTTYSIDGPALASNSLVLNVTGGPANMRWVGGGANPARWENTQLDANWTTTDSVTDFYDGDFARSTTQRSRSTRRRYGRPRSITVANGGGTTTVRRRRGSVIAGNTGLTMTSDGTGALVIGTNNTFSGPVLITAGTVSISSSAQPGNAMPAMPSRWPAALRATATLDLGRRAVTLGTGGGTLDVVSAGTLTISECGRRGRRGRRPHQERGGDARSFGLQHLRRPYGHLG